MANITLILYVMATICFALGGVSVSLPPLNWMNLGLTFLTLSLYMK